MQFDLLGSLAVTGAAGPVDLGRPRQRLVLLSLLLNANRVVPIDKLADWVFEHERPGNPTATLQVHLSRLRAALSVAGAQDRVVSRRPGYLVRVSPGELDLERFERLRAEGRAAVAEGRGVEGAEILRSALAVWRGPALADAARYSFAQSEIARLEELRLTTVEDLLDLRILLGGQREAVAELEELVAEHPLRERLWAQLMRALYRCGRQADALASYERLRHGLRAHGLEPSLGVQALERAISMRARELEVPHFLPPAVDGPTPVPDGGRAATRRPGGVPRPRTRFVGRESDRAALTESLGRQRLVTITGLGGSGKTRLAIEVARCLEPRFADGVRMADLSSMAAPQLVPAALAIAVGAPRAPDRLGAEGVADFLAARELLLVVDGCDQVLAATAPAVSAILSACRDVRVLVTSREPLGLIGEAVWRLQPLSLPASPQPACVADLAGSEAVELFVGRAGLHQPGFELTDDDAPLVASLCRRLGGIPLGIEAQAAKLDGRSLADVALALEQPPGPGPGPGQGTDGDSLRATLDRSYGLLEPAERAVFRRLAVAPDGVALGAAASVCAGGDATPDDVGRALYRLVDKSLVVADVSRPESRYRVPDPARAYALERLRAVGEVEATRRSHAAWCASLAEQAEASLTGPRQLDWLRRLDVEATGMHAAVDWATEAEPETAQRLAGALVLYWKARGLAREGHDRLRSTLAAGAPRPNRFTPKASWGAALLGCLLGRVREAVGLLMEAVAGFGAAGDVRWIGRCQLVLGLSALLLAGPADAFALLEEAEAIGRLGRDGWTTTHALVYGGWALVGQRRLDEARPRLEKAAATAREAGDGQSLALALRSLGHVALLEGDHPWAQTLLADALMLARKVGDVHETAAGLCQLAELAARAGDPEAARERLVEALAIESSPAVSDPVVGSLTVMEGLAARGLPGGVTGGGPAAHRTPPARAPGAKGA